MFDTQSLTLGEVSAIEDLSGLPIGALADEDKPKGKALTALAYIIKRREDSTFTFAMASKLTMADVGKLTGSTDEPEIPAAPGLDADAPKAPEAVPLNYDVLAPPSSPSSSSDSV